MTLLNVSLWLLAAVLAVVLVSMVFGLLHMAVMMARQQEF
ncbi:Uncharacterised protein [Neisseria animalis]|nr:Uncharacterised protein [Neisseria animalis]